MARACDKIALNLKRKWEKETLEARKRAKEEESDTESESEPQGNLEVNMWLFDMYYAQRRRWVAQAQKYKDALATEKSDSSKDSAVLKTSTSRPRIGRQTKQISSVNLKFKTAREEFLSSWHKEREKYIQECQEHQYKTGHLKDVHTQY